MKKLSVKADLIVRAVDEIIEGKLDYHFPSISGKLVQAPNQI
jgi:hypothetical protein